MRNSYLVDLAPLQGKLFYLRFPGLKPWAASSNPGKANPFRAKSSQILFRVGADRVGAQRWRPDDSFPAIERLKASRACPFLKSARRYIILSPIVRLDRS